MSVIPSRMRSYPSLLLFSACGGGGGGGGDGTSVAQTQPPSALTYTSPTIAVVGTPVSLSPHVSGSVQSFAISPALPAGLALNAATGVIAGTPSAIAAKTAYSITATNAAGSANFSITLTVNPAAPSALSYPGLAPFLIGKSASVTPTFKSVASSFLLTPPTLPAGMSFSTTTGVISGTPTALAAPAAYTVRASNVTASTSASVSIEVDASPTVHLSAAATDPQGLALTYLWKTTDGSLVNVKGAQSDWILPSGPGIHFAYVLVKNGQGGYAETRIAVKTDTIGNPLQPIAPVLLAPPARAARVGDPIRIPLHVPFVFVYLQGAVNRYPALGALLSDKHGEVVFQNVAEAPGSKLTPFCSIDGINFSSTTCVQPNIPITPISGGSLWATTGYAGQLYEATIDLLPGPGAVNPNNVIVPITATGASKCGTIDEFFGIDSVATATFRDVNGNSLYFNVPVGDKDTFAVPYPFAQGQVVTLSCEGVTALSIPFQAQVANPISGFLAISQPSITALTATFNGQQIASLGAAPAPQPADVFTQTNKFLAFPGLDSQISACQYYVAIGVASGCGSNGVLQTTMSFDDWRKQVRIDRVCAARRSADLHC